MKKRILILGGTGEAQRLASELTAHYGDAVVVITSLAGRTRYPQNPAGEVRIGGFGGIQGLQTYITDEAIDMVLDATHPFASQISAHAVTACERTQTPRLALIRPAWHAEEGDTWHHVPSLQEAAALLPSLGSTAFLTIGSQELHAFNAVEGVAFAIRMVDPPEEPLAGVADNTGLQTAENTILILGKGPFDLEDEKTLLETHRIDVLVTKNSGGEATRAKLIAARAAGIPVIMVERPPAPPGLAVSSVKEALDWIAQQI